MAGSQFSANASILGYLYQMRYGLLLLLREDNDDARVAIETLDDVSIEADSIGVYQTKYHSASAPNLTDRSSDFWKTIRVWSEHISSGLLNPVSTFFNLLTSVSISDESVLKDLRHDTIKNRDAQAIELKLLTIAKSPNPSDANARSYAAFLALTPADRLELIKRIQIIDSSVNIDEVRDGCIRELRNSAIKKEELLERLEGWFFGEVVRQLQNQREAISRQELTLKIAAILESITLDNLPADFLQSINNDETQLAPYRGYFFVRQLEEVGASVKVINNAISDYHRAFEQTSKWQREGLILPSEPIAYHEKLTDDWQRKFDALCDVADGETVDDLKRKGLNFYTNFYVLSHPPIYIRPRFTEPWAVIGSCQMLSDKKKIGWHPKYQDIEG